MCFSCQSLSPEAEVSFTHVFAALTESSDAAATVSTIYSLSAADTFSGTLQNAIDEDWVRIVIPAGEQWTISAQGVSGQAEPYTELFSSAGVYITGETSYDVANNISTMV